ncbi:hypothetical protein RF11_08157 [Thelohanellus kitauei]|uniref:Uncharacterized protein n=1 Tax=Thelohanellus kitauei TaxID=669202 RepID=A0A0C2MRD5_THEKT|nr:hypothetical protein RF11_08157 [Thelohanellus kitauei]
MTVDITYKNNRKDSHFNRGNEQILYHLKYHSDKCNKTLMISNDDYPRYEKKFYAEFNILDVFYGIEETGLVEVDDENYKNKHGDFHIKYPAILIEYTHDNFTFEKIFMSEYVYEQQKGVKIYEGINEREDSLNECKINVQSKNPINVIFCVKSTSIYRLEKENAGKVVFETICSWKLMKA